MAKRIVLTARIVIDPGSEGPESIRRYAISALKNTFKNVRDGTIATFIYEDGHLRGADMSGEPNDQLQSKVENAFGSREGDAA